MTGIRLKLVVSKTEIRLGRQIDSIERTKDGTEGLTKEPGYGNVPRVSLVHPLFHDSTLTCIFNNIGHLMQIKATLFIPCLTDQFDLEAGKNAVRVLEKLGVEVAFADQHTCWASLFNAGYREKAIPPAKKAIRDFGTRSSSLPPQGAVRP